MGEERKYVYNVGSPAIDSIRKNKLAAGPALEKLVKFNLNSPWLLMVQHPVTTIPESAYLQAKETLEAIRHFKIPTIILYPNADAGGRDIIAAINEYKNQPYLRIYKNLTRDIYLGLLKHAFALIGNSSSGIIEAPFFHVPVVNIGIRQAGRQRSTNIIDVAHKRSDIIKAIKKALFEKKFIRQVNKCKNQYGDGHASERIVKVLSNIKINANLIQKQIIY
jgi:UDP-hydrolysing UDP-N-acetyl-D-glucosamine 2-epimerase